MLLYFKAEQIYDLNFRITDIDKFLLRDTLQALDQRLMNAGPAFSRSGEGRIDGRA